MCTLRRSALNKMLEGVTTLSEVFRVSASDSV
jgi:type II secretory ATPase GspE/PulE/Tfp pilus assembly ATPase PilB-like protein